MKYKLCRVENLQQSKVYPIDENGEEHGDMLLSYEDSEPQVYYAIYENLGDDNDEDWDEWGYYEDDFAKAKEAYEQLKKKGE